MRLAAALLLALALAAPGAPAQGKARGDQPLGAARVTLLSGAAASSDRRPLRQGDTLAPGERLRLPASAEARLELRFPDGSLLRLGPSADLTLVPDERRVLLRGGRLMVQGDRMIGGVAVWTSRVALLPLGTTYLVEVAEDGAVTALVLEGALQALRSQGDRPRVLLPGEALRVVAAGPLPAPAERSLTEVLEAEPLLRAFPAPLETLPRLRDLADQQRRGVLRGRNERLRRELTWRRPPLPPIELPDELR